MRAMKVPRAVKRITFTPSKASPGETLYVHVPKLNENEVPVPGSLALRFDIDLAGGHANKFLVQNVSRALVSRMRHRQVFRRNLRRHDGLQCVEDI